MATLKFDVLNISVQVGDMLFASKLTSGQGGSNNPNSGATDTKPKILGEITAVNRATSSITYTAAAGSPTPNSAHFIMFGKNKAANYSGITGYFAETEYRNESTLPAEIFATAVDYTVSSK